jgi:hypothetical protein
MIRRRRVRACLAALRPVCLLILLVHLPAASPGQFEDFPPLGDLGQPVGGSAGLDARTLDLVDASEAGIAEAEQLLGPLAETFTIDHLIIGTKLLLRGAPGALGRVESVLADLGVVAERHTCETVPLYYVRDAESVNEMLSELAQSAGAFGEVSIATSTAGDARPALVLYGPRSQVEDLRRIIATIDVPHPEVRLDIWAFQISGSNATRVADRAEKADECIRAVAHLIRGYLQQLEKCALDEQRRNEPTEYVVGQLPEGAGARPADAQAESTKPKTVALGGAGSGGLAGLLSRLAVASNPDVGVPDVAMGIRPTARRRVAVVPSGRGVHPLSLTETLATLILIRPREGSVKATLEGDLRGHLAEWLGEQDADPLATWERLLEQDDVVRGDERLAAVAATLREAQEEGTSDGAADAVLPVKLLDMLGDEAYVDLAQATLSGFLLDWQTNATDWRSLPPGQLGRRAADARAVLQAAEQALAEDIRSLFLRPLVGELRGLAGEGGREGLAEASQTSIGVLSGTQAEVVGSAVSYFDVEAQPELEASAAIAGPQPAGVLEAALEEDATVWSVLTSGAELTVTPHVLPGGGAAELEIALTVNHQDHEVAAEGAAPAVVPLSRVAQHKAKTRVYVNSLDVFGLSSLSLRTTQPRADLAVPILGRLPLLGRMFRFPRGPNKVHHASMLLVVSTILPTGADLGATLDFEAYAEGT